MVAVMCSVKEKALKLLENMPNNSSYDEILKEFAFAKMIELGLADVDTGKTISNEELTRRIQTWQK